MTDRDKISELRLMLFRARTKVSFYRTLISQKEREEAVFEGDINSTESDRIAKFLQEIDELLTKTQS